MGGISQAIIWRCLKMFCFHCNCEFSDAFCGIIILEVTMTRCYEESRAFVSSLRLDDRDERMRDNCLFWDICPSELVGRYLEGRERGGGGGCDWLYGCIPPESYSVFQAGCIYIAEISHVENVNELILNWALVTQADNTLAGEKPTWSQLDVFQVFSITHLRLFCFLSTGSLLSCVTLFLAVWRFVKT